MESEHQDINAPHPQEVLKHGHPALTDGTKKRVLAICPWLQSRSGTEPRIKQKWSALSHHITQKAILLVQLRGLTFSSVQCYMCVLGLLGTGMV